MNALTTAYRAARKTGTKASLALATARYNLRLADSGLSRYAADHVLTIGDTMFTIKVEHDADSSPFEWDCFYGTPTKNLCRSWIYDRSPGQVLIGNNRGSYVYDRSAALAECLRQHGTWPRGTRFDQAVEAVDAEIEYWTQWLNDDRYFIGVVVTAESAEGFTAESSCWGIEAGDRDGYWRSVAMDLISDCQHEITAQKVQRVYALNDALEADFAGLELA